MHQPSDVELVAEGRFLQFVRRGAWEYVTRRGASGVVVVAALTPEGNVLLVEQYRPAIERTAIEFPAGLAGDEAGAEHEELAEAAQRELIEETGYRAAGFKEVFTGPSSAGLTDEMVTLFIATGLERQATGGGVAGERITVHEIPLGSVDRWLDDRARAGWAIDLRVYTGLYFLRREAAEKHAGA